MSAETPVEQPVKRRPKALLVAAVALVVLLVAVVVSWFVAGSKASGFSDDLGAWADEQRDVVITATDDLPGSVFILGDDPDYYSEDSLKEQKAACDEVGERREKVKKAADAMPDVGSGVLGVFRPGLRSAAKKSDEATETLDAYAKPALAALEQIERDCTWNIKANTLGAEASKLWDDADKLLDPKQATSRFVCDHEDGCIPYDLKKREQWVDRVYVALDFTKDEIIANFDSDECRATSYGDFCDEYVARLTAEDKAKREWYTWVRANKDQVDIRGLDEQDKLWDDAHEKAAKDYNEAFEKAFEDLEFHHLKDQYRWTEAFFADVTAQTFADLEPQRAAVVKLK